MGIISKGKREEKRRWVAAKIKMQEETKLDTREKRDPILDKKMANRYLVACTYGYIVYTWEEEEQQQEEGEEEEEEEEDEPLMLEAELQA